MKPVAIFRGCLGCLTDDCPQWDKGACIEQQKREPTALVQCKLTEEEIEKL